MCKPKNGGKAIQQKKSNNNKLYQNEQITKSIRKNTAKL